jgi:hypothetical protein
MDNAFVLNELINLYLHKKQRLYCCFIDYQKAFDTINRSALWGKLIKNGINGKIVRVIYNMYDSAKSYVKQQSMISGIFACNVGVRQHTVIPTFNCLLYTPIVCFIELSALILPNEMSALID